MFNNGHLLGMQISLPVDQKSVPLVDYDLFRKPNIELKMRRNVKSFQDNVMGQLKEPLAPLSNYCEWIKLSAETDRQYVEEVCVT